MNVYPLQMNILLCGANFEIFLEKLENIQHLTNTGDQENPVFRWVELINLYGALLL